MTIVHHPDLDLLSAQAGLLYQYCKVFSCGVWVIQIIDKPLLQDASLLIVESGISKLDQHGMICFLGILSVLRLLTMLFGHRKAATLLLNVVRTLGLHVDSTV